MVFKIFSLKIFCNDNYMKLKNYLNEKQSAKEALMKIIKRNGVFADDIDYKLNKLNRNAESYDDFSEEDFKKVKKRIRKRY